MNRRHFLKRAALTGPFLAAAAGDFLDPASASVPVDGRSSFLNTAKGRDWLARWETNITNSARSRYCDKEMGEELGWLVSPFLNGFYYGYLATRDPKWVEMLCDWTDSCIRRAVRKPDGFMGWPKDDGGRGEAQEATADSLLGEAMMLRPVVLMAGEISKNQALKEKFGSRAQGYIELAGKIFQKWDARDCWREVEHGGVWIVPEFGVGGQSGTGLSGYADRKVTGFTNPDNKQNHIARWMVAMHDVTKKTVYRERAEKWFRFMKLRIKTRGDGKYCVWNYWEPAGPWDYKPDGTPKHWVGVHPNGGYYNIDVQGIVCAFEHGLVFRRADVNRLIATNRDFMWNQSVEGAQFQRIDGGQPDPRWKNSPGLLWECLAPYDETLRAIFLANHNPSGWDGLSTTPWFLAGGD